MRILLGWDTLEEHMLNKTAILTVGSFDGIHCGHRKLLKQLLFQAKNNQVPSLVLSFEPHPRLFFQDQDFALIYSTEEKAYWLEKLGIDFLGIVPFDAEFASLSAGDFMSLVRDKLRPSGLVIGKDHGFGMGRKGGVETLYEMQLDRIWQIYAVNDCEYQGIKVSSSEIRRALMNRNIIRANALLGRAYTYSGIVVKGNQKGRSLGFPTANIFNDEPGLLCPPQGVYAVRVQIEGDENLYMGMLNIGLRPTLNRSEKMVVEVYILHFDREIYGLKLRLFFYEFMRSEQKFPSVQALVHQLCEDRSRVENYFRI